MKFRLELDEFNEHNHRVLELEKKRKV